MTDEELKNAIIEHSGTKNQKWYKRKYQNPDGTWTELGKRMRREEYAKKQKKKKKLEKKLAKKLKKEEKREAKELKKQKELEMDEYRKNYGSYVKNLSDDELRSRTNRLKLEKEYIDAEYNRIKKEAEYKELTKRPEKHPMVKAGMKKAQEAVVSQATTAIGDLTKSAVTMAGRKVLKNYFGEDMYEEMFGDKKTAKQKRDEREKKAWEKQDAITKLGYMKEFDKANVQEKYDAAYRDFEKDRKKFESSARSYYNRHVGGNSKQADKYINSIMEKYDNKYKPTHEQFIKPKSVKERMDEYDLMKKAGYVKLNY